MQASDLQRGQRRQPVHGIDRMVRNVRTGRFERSLSALTAAGALVTAAEIYFEHDSASFGNKMMWIPVALGPIGAAAGVAARDLDRMRQARAIIGDDVELFVDANGGYGRKQAVRVMDAAADLDVRWFEEPVSSDDLEGLREVRDGVSADVTAGEYGWDLYYFRRMCAAGTVDCLQADVSRCGGITEWLRVAAIAASYGLQISGHCAPHLHAHAAAAVPNLRHLEWFHDHVRIKSLFFDGTLDPSGGVIRPDPAAPGLGLPFKAADAKRYRVT